VKINDWLFPLPGILFMEKRFYKRRKKPLISASPQFLSRAYYQLIIKKSPEIETDMKRQERLDRFPQKKKREMRVSQLMNE